MESRAAEAQRCPQGDLSGNLDCVEEEGRDRKETHSPGLPCVLEGRGGSASLPLIPGADSGH